MGSSSLRRTIYVCTLLRLITFKQLDLWKNRNVIFTMYEGVTKSFRTGRLERELQMIHLSITKYSSIAFLWVIPVSFAAIILCVASQRVFIVVSVYFVMTQSGNFWIHPRASLRPICCFVFLRCNVSLHVLYLRNGKHEDKIGPMHEHHAKRVRNLEVQQWPQLEMHTSVYPKVSGLSR
jgi:hypothetical protein